VSTGYVGLTGIPESAAGNGLPGTGLASGGALDDRPNASGAGAPQSAALGAALGSGAEDGTGRGSARNSTSFITSPRATLIRTSCPAAIVVRAADTSSAPASGLPLTARISSPVTMPARSAGPPAATESTRQRPGTSDSATDRPSQPLPGTAAEAACSVVIRDGGATDGIDAAGAEKGRVTGSPIEISLG
jgi:hypothetical protein